MPRIVVLGTGTGVGKTYFTVALARALRRLESRPRVIALKPVETGVVRRKKATEGSDASELERASTDFPSIEHPLYAYPDPVSPHLAARRARLPISVARVAAYVSRAECSKPLHDTTLRWVLVETAGGALSPLGARTTNLDLARALDPAVWILVAPDALGVLHDLRATLTALRHFAREPDFVALTASRAKDASTGTNARELARLAIVEPIATLSRGRGSGAGLSRLVSALARHPLRSR